MVLIEEMVDTAPMDQAIRVVHPVGRWQEVVAWAVWIVPQSLPERLVDGGHQGPWFCAGHAHLPGFAGVAAPQCSTGAGSLVVCVAQYRCRNHGTGVPPP
jgi:hypothetical protein